MGLCLAKGRIIDPENGIDKVANLYVEDGVIAAVGRAPKGFIADETLDVSGQIVAPGFVELSAHLREPGFEYKASITTECKAAAAGGFTSVCCTPDTYPVNDNPSVVEHIKQRAGRARASRVYCLGALTHGLDGEILSEMRSLKESGCVGVTNADRAIKDTGVLRHALAYAASCELTVFLHPREHWLSAEGRMHEGAVSTRLGIPGIPEADELIALSRDLILVEETGVRAHFCRLSSARSINLISRARRAGLPVSADVALPNLIYTDKDIGSYDSQFHLRPPVREPRDRTRLLAAVKKGDIDAICGNHEPHEADAKATPFSLSAPGVSSLETFLPELLSLVAHNKLDLTTAINAVSVAPNRILGLPAGSLAAGSPADLCVFDPEREWQVRADDLLSSGKNTPALNTTVKGRVSLTVIDGRVVFRDLP